MSKLLKRRNLSQKDNFYASFAKNLVEEHGDIEAYEWGYYLGYIDYEGYAAWRIYRFIREELGYENPLAMVDCLVDSADFSMGITDAKGDKNNRV